MLYDLLKTRRSIRKFKDKEVEKEKVDTILKSALFSPSSRSRMPWEFIAVTEKDLLIKLSQCREHSSSFLAGAPLGIAVIANPSKCDVWIEDASIAAIIIQLSAFDLGLGSCWIQIRDRASADGALASDYVKEALNIPGEFEVECIIAIGYPNEKKQPHSENKLPYEKLHYNKYDN